MLDLDDLNIDRFKIKIDGSTVEINPPKKKVLSKIMGLSKQSTDNPEEVIEGVYQSVELILNSNKTGRKFDADFIEDKFDLPMANTLITKYFEWVQTIKTNPN
jgi:hypothetical protein